MCYVASSYIQSKKLQVNIDLILVGRSISIVNNVGRVSYWIKMDTARNEERTDEYDRKKALLITTAKFYNHPPLGPSPQCRILITWQLWVTSYAVHSLSQWYRCCLWSLKIKVICSKAATFLWQNMHSLISQWLPIHSAMKFLYQARAWF